MLAEHGIALTNVAALHIANMHMTRSLTHVAHMIELRSLT